MKRLGVAENEYSFDRDLRNGGLIQFFYNGRNWSYERTKDMMLKHGIHLKSGKEAWAQLVLGLQDLVRLHERKVFDFTAGAVVGLKALPPPLPECFRVMDFNSIPDGFDQVEQRFKDLSKVRHSDILKDDGTAFKKLKQAKDDCERYFGGLKS
jgi:hypothetical protein